jgi:uncharacterized membrane protein YjfL (UPF0719 family)
MFRKLLIAIALFLTTFSTSFALPELIGGSTQVGKDLATADSATVATWFQTTFLNNWINILIGWCAALAVVFIIIGAYQYLTAAGDEEQIKTGKKTITWSLLGVLVALLAFAIVQIIVNIDLGKPFSQGDGGLIPEGQTIDGVQDLPNPEFKEELLPAVARFLIYATGIVSFVMFFYAGALLVIGYGEEENVKKARNIIIWGITGLAFAAVSYILVKSVLDFDLNPNVNTQQDGYTIIEESIERVEGMV